MRIHLVDGTYELFRAYFGAPSALGSAGSEVGAVRGILRSLLSLIAVGTPVTRCPPHRSQRAQFTHWAPTWGE